MSLNNPSVLPYFLIGSIISVVLGYMHKIRRVVSKKSALLELLGISFLLSIIATMTFSVITVSIIGSASDLLSWVLILLFGTRDGLVNGLLTSLVGPELLAQLLDKTLSVFIAYFVIRAVPSDYFRNKLVPRKPKKKIRIGKRSKYRVIRTRKNISTIRKRN